MEEEQIILKLSDSIYGNFQVFLPKQIVSQNTKEALISHIIHKLGNVLSMYNLKELLKGLYEKNWHIHDDVKNNSIIYICSTK